MLRNTTSGERIGKELPAGAELADKTGVGGYDVINGAGVIRSGREQVTAAIMTRADDAKAAGDPTVLQRVAGLMVDAFVR